MYNTKGLSTGPDSTLG